MKVEIIEISKRPDLLSKAVEYFWRCWGSERNFKFYQDCIIHSTDETKSLPKFYIILDNEEIIASCALLTNDIISTQDLIPWLACLFVNEPYRDKGIAELLLKHGLEEAKGKGYEKLYLSTDLENFYERKGWKYLTNGFNTDDSEIKIYEKSTN